MSNTKDNVSPNREYKDRLFTMIFGDKTNKQNICNHSAKAERLQAASIFQVAFGEMDAALAYVTRSLRTNQQSDWC